MDNAFVSKERLYLDTDGNVVGETDPDKVSLLVGVGGSLSLDVAQRYGLVGSSASENAKPATVSQEAYDALSADRDRLAAANESERGAAEARLLAAESEADRFRGDVGELRVENADLKKQIKALQDKAAAADKLSVKDKASAAKPTTDATPLPGSAEVAVELPVQGGA